MNDPRTRKAMRHLARANELVNFGSSLEFGSLKFVKEFVMDGKKAQKGVQLTLSPYGRKIPEKKIVCKIKSVEGSDERNLVDKSVTFKYIREENDIHEWSLVHVGEGWSCDEGPFIGYTWTSSKGFKDLYTAKVEMNENKQVQEFQKYLFSRDKKYMDWEEDEPQATLDDILDYSGSTPDEVDQIQIGVGKTLYDFTIKKISRTKPDMKGVYVSAECEPENKEKFGSKVKLFGRIENGLPSIKKGTITTETDMFLFRSEDADKFRLFLQKDPKDVAVYENVSELMEAMSKSSNEKKTPEG